jgi:S-adenosylmethionine:tRNA ribosyltransferase-isomerase
MRLSDFDFDLPDELIAKEPAPERSGSRLLVPRTAARIEDRRFTDLPSLLSAGDLIVFNDSRVLRARLRGRKATGGAVEGLVERIIDSDIALAQLRMSKPAQAGSLIYWRKASAEVLGREGEFWRLRFDAPVLEILEQEGELPLPPYIDRQAKSTDDERYQTTYARQPGSVAAPTAGLHFDDTLMAALEARGVQRAFVTLHVGAGTFQPVRVDDVSQHRMHSERYRLTPEVAQAVRDTRKRGGRVIAVGTTSLRTLEAAAIEHESGWVEASEGETDLFITPGYRFRVVDCLITNFHLPRSTLIMLVSAFAGPALIRAAYDHAIAERYRFFSYGDAMLLERERAPDRR